MRATRWSVYPTAPFMPGHLAPAMIVMRAQDMTMPPEEADDTPGALVINDTWEMADGDGDLETAIAQAIIRAGERRQVEDNMATLYHWTAGFFRPVKAGGVIITERPAPLGRDDITTVLHQLCEHPDYDRHRIHVVSGVDGASVRTEDGRVIVDNNPRKD